MCGQPVWDLIPVHTCIHIPTHTLSVAMQLVPTASHTSLLRFKIQTHIDKYAHRRERTRVWVHWVPGGARPELGSVFSHNHECSIATLAARWSDHNSCVIVFRHSCDPHTCLFTYICIYIYTYAWNQEACTIAGGFPCNYPLSYVYIRLLCRNIYVYVLSATFAFVCVRVFTLHISN